MSRRAIREQMIAAAHEHTQLQWSHRCVASLRRGNRIINEGRSGRWRSKYRADQRKSRSLDETKQWKLLLHVRISPLERHFRSWKRLLTCCLDETLQTCRHMWHPGLDGAPPDKATGLTLIG
ncbi:hypothetical protein EVAR_56097_1 [Eumeta japonica]|uniref:Uncharacterized protein n=1 Tax=Eumeta variegata TaxID=151549 RepID=A0A4C1YFW4_EUMVA|nr:hypothetical protein EVAR_56097_1 [Eumeta japonica]